MRFIVSILSVALLFACTAQAAYTTTKIFSGFDCVGTMVMQSSQRVSICSATELCVSPYTGVNNNFPGEWSGKTICFNDIPPNPFGFVVRTYTDQNCSDSAGFSAGWFAVDTCLPNSAGAWIKYVCNGTANAISYRCTDSNCSSCTVNSRYTWPEGEDHKCTPPSSGGTYATYVGCHATIGTPSSTPAPFTIQPKAAPTPSNPGGNTPTGSNNNNRSGSAIKSLIISWMPIFTLAIAAVLL